VVTIAGGLAGRAGVDMATERLRPALFNRVHSCVLVG
jgi:hypothetical protein